MAGAYHAMLREHLGSSGEWFAGDAIYLGLNPDAEQHDARDENSITKGVHVLRLIGLS